MNAGDWVDSARRFLDTLRPGADEVEGSAGGGHAADCRWCPVCQTAAVLRGERPEVTAALADVLTTTAAVLRDLAEAGRPTAETTEEPAAAPEPGTGTDPLVVQRIDIA